MKLKFNCIHILDVCILIAIFASFFSIPLFSFQSKLYYLTWGFTALAVVLMLISMIFFSGIKIDVISISFVLFAISSVISSALTQFKAFKITAPILSILAFLIYSYCKSNTAQTKKMFIAIYLGNIAFALVFLFTYRKEILTLNFSRLGSLFGDINDVSLLMGLGFLFAFYYAFFSKKIVFKILNCLSSILFLLCGITTGSKIFIFSLVVTYIFVIVLFFGKKRWWLSLIIIIGTISIFIVALQLPIMNTVRKRLLEFFQTFFDFQTNENIGTDFSTISRYDMFIDGIEMFLRKPFFGWGIWGFATYGGLNNGWSHNHFSETLCNFGIIGTLFFHVGFIKSIVNIFKGKNNRDKYIDLLIVVFFIVSMFSVALNSEKIYSYLAPIAFCNLCQKEKYYHFNLLSERFVYANKNS